MAEEEWAYEEATDAEKMRIAQQFLLATPPGQVHEVLRDVAKLVPGHVLTDATLRDALHTYNVQHVLPVDVLDGDYKILICEDAEVDSEHYVDPIGKRVLGFDHVKQQLIPGDISDETDAFDTPFEKERAMVQKAFQSYIQFEFMHQGTVGVYVQGSSLIVNLCTERVNLRNFWSGRWRSRWEVELTSSPPQVDGKIELHVHYFENGNLQLQSAKEVDAQELDANTPSQLGDALLRVVKEAEDSLQSNLEDMYLNMSQETFKEMRRVMPVTQTKMEWNLNAHRTAKDLVRK